MPSDDGLTPVERERLRKERLKETMDEIGEMDDVISGVEFEEESKPVEEQPKVPVEPKEPVEEVVSVSPEDKETTDEPSATDVTPVDEYDFDFINEMARMAMTKGSAPVAEKPVEAVKPKEEPVAQTVQATVPSVPIESLITLEDMQQAFESPEKMLMLIGKVYQKAVTDAEERALLRLPGVARQVSMQVADQARRLNKFYEDHSELQPFKDFVRYCAQQVEAKHPDWTFEQVADETAKLAKSRLPALRRAQRDSKQRPALPGGGRVAQRRDRAMQAGLSQLEQEIAEMPDTAF